MTVFAVDGETLAKVAEAGIGKWAEGLAFSRDGSTILVQSVSFSGPLRYFVGMVVSSPSARLW